MNVTITGFLTVREARAFAKALEFVNDSAISVEEVTNREVKIYDREQSYDQVINLNLDMPLGVEE